MVKKVGAKDKLEDMDVSLRNLALHVASGNREHYQVCYIRQPESGPDAQGHRCKANSYLERVFESTPSILTRILDCKELTVKN